MEKFKRNENWQTILAVRIDFLVGAFLKKKVDYSHCFSSVFFFDTPEVTKIVLPKVSTKFCIVPVAPVN